MDDLYIRNNIRLLKSIRGEKPDAHPFYLWFNFPFVKSVTGVDMDRYFHDPATMFEAQLELISQLDGCAAFYPDFGVVPESSGLGGKIRFDNKGFISVSASGINGMEDVRKMKPADPYGSNYMRKCLETLDYMKTHMPQGKGYALDAAKLVGPFTVAAQTYGITELCLEIYDNPDLVKALIDIAAETGIRFMKEQEKILGKLDYILIADDIAAFLSEKDFREMVVPSYDRIFAEFPGVERRYHNDANAFHLAGAIADAGFSLWHMGHMFSILDAAAKSDNRITICGDLEPVVFAGLSEEEAENACNELLTRFDGNTSLVLSTGGFFSYGTPIANVKALMRSADQRKYSD